MEKSYRPIKNLLEQMTKFSNFAGDKINIQTLTIFPYSSNKDSENEILKCHLP